MLDIGVDVCHEPHQLVPQGIPHLWPVPHIPQRWQHLQGQSEGDRSLWVPKASATHSRGIWKVATSRALPASPPLSAAPLNVGLSTAYPGLQELPGLPVDSGTLRQQVQHRGQALLQLVALQKHPQKEQHVSHTELCLSGSCWGT